MKTDIHIYLAEVRRMRNTSEKSFIENQHTF